jgi:hypothetical protein
MRDKGKKTESGPNLEKVCCFGKLNTMTPKLIHLGKLLLENIKISANCRIAEA